MTPRERLRVAEAIARLLGKEEAADTYAEARAYWEAWAGDCMAHEYAASRAGALT